MRIKVIHFEDDCWSAPSDKARDFIEFFQDKINEIPKEFRDTAEINMDSDTRYGCDYLTLEISYKRDETDNEISKRESQKLRREKIKTDRDLLELKYLQNKYPDFK